MRILNWGVLITVLAAIFGLQAISTMLLVSNLEYLFYFSLLVFGLALVYFAARQDKVILIIPAFLLICTNPQMYYFESTMLALGGEYFQSDFEKPAAYSLEYWIKIAFEALVLVMVRLCLLLAGFVSLRNLFAKARM